MNTVRPVVFNPTAGFVASPYGKPAFDRRLSDKILAAHNHAYATGDTRLAGELLALLERTEESEREAYRRKSSGSFGSYHPRSTNAAAQAGLWRAYVDARNIHNALSLQAGVSRHRLSSAATEMRRCYAKWSLA